MADHLFEMPQAFRDAAEQNMRQTHAAYEQLMDFMTKALSAWTDAMPENPMTVGFKVVQGRVMDFAKDNAESAFTFSAKINNAKTLQEVLTLQTQFAQERMQAFVTHTLQRPAPDRIDGMIADRDILLRGPAGGRSMWHTKAQEVMTVGAVACHDTDGHSYNSELTGVAVAPGSSKAEAVQAANKEFEQEHKTAPLGEHGSKPSQNEQIRQRAYELWEQEGRPEGRQDEHWARACREVQREGQ